MFPEAFAAEESEGIAAPGRQCAEGEGFKPDVSDADDHQIAEKNPRVGETGNGIEGALAGDLPVDDPGEKGKIDPGDHAGEIEDGPCVEESQQRLEHDIDIHHPGRTIDFQALQAATVFIAAENAADRKEQHARDLGEKHAGQHDGDHDNSGSDSLFQW